MVVSKKKLAKKKAPSDRVTIKCSMGIRLSIMYQSGGVDFGIERQCDLNEIGKISKACWELCEEQIGEKIQEVQGDLVEFAKENR